ncbi:MAG: undecaprenyl diphosphate synthase family protein [Acidobacteriia bacterium]|nr:undecaprenyl diphosphate synthase family protein [Terriglobia bacterium]
MRRPPRPPPAATRESRANEAAEGPDRRLSDFLLWECAYAELHFCPTLWPDFGSRDLRRAVAD